MIKYKHGADKNIVWMFLIGIIIILALGGMIQKQYNLFSTMSEATMTRTVPSSVQPNSNFQITYSTALTGKWGASIVDEVSGGCTFPAGTTLKSVMLSDEGNTKTITITAPSSGSCTFSGDYKFGSEEIKVFSDKTVTISASASNQTTCTSGQTKCEGQTYYICSNNAWVSQGLVNGKCGYTSTSGNGEVVPSFDLNKVLFKLGDFKVTLLMFLLVVGGVVLIILLKK